MSVVDIFKIGYARQQVAAGLQIQGFGNPWICAKHRVLLTDPFFNGLLSAVRVPQPFWENTTAMMQLEAIQTALTEAGLDGWLFFDHHRRDPLAYAILDLPTDAHVTRRWSYFVPAKGTPRKLVHRVEPKMLDLLPGETTIYARWQEQEAGLRALFAGAQTIAMQYSPRCAVPYVATVDAGTVELIRSLGVDVVSSADLVQQFEARWTPAMLESHLEAGERIDRIRSDAFDLVSRAVAAGEPLDEHRIQEFIMARFREEDLETDCPPIVAVNANASDPHYAPSATASAPVQRGDLLLLDMWAKRNVADGVYYDVTWMAYVGDDPPQAMRDVFAVVTGARDAGIALVESSRSEGRTLRGFEVDDAVRGHIDRHGFGDYFGHRTGHSIGREVHGVGANMDNMETHDERPVIAWTCFSIEPGIYLPEFGLRSEVDVFVGDNDVRVTGPIQTELVLL